jgi:DNA-binding transcriptional LysR family regulator
LQKKSIGESTLTLQQLRYAIKVAECGSISEAAAQLFISQPSLSFAVKELEREIKVVIFLRTNRGIIATAEGEEFLGYARQVVQQAELLEAKYISGTSLKQRFSVSAQHYTFIANAFVDLIKKFGGDEYEFTLRETTTYGIIEDVRNLRSEIGVLYLSPFNDQIIMKLLKENGLIFEELLAASPHVFISRTHPLSSRSRVTLDDLEDFPCLSFEQGAHNSFYFAEEILSTRSVKKSIKVTDRAAIINMLIGVNAYTISTGIFPSYLHGDDIVAIPLETDCIIRVGVITHKDYLPTHLGQIYLKALEDVATSVSR